MANMNNKVCLTHTDTPATSPCITCFRMYSRQRGRSLLFCGVRRQEPKGKWQHRKLSHAQKLSLWKVN